MYMLCKEMNDLFLGQGTFYYRPGCKKERTWHKKYGRLYYTKEGVRRALKRLNDPEIKIKKVD